MTDLAFIAKTGQEVVIESGRRLQSISLLEENVYGARLDEDLYELICVKENRDILRSVLIQTYFSSSIHNKLLERSLINLESFQYSQSLIEQTLHPNVLKRKTSTYGNVFRSYSGSEFRRIIVKLYEHRCAFCELRLVTVDGHTAVGAAHIIPRYVSYNDNPTNGIALCKLCHWTFDKGLLSVSGQYRIMVSPQIHHDQNIPKHVIYLDKKAILIPQDKALWPNKQSFALGIVTTNFVRFELDSP
ncbi:MAG: HNH endonuclease [Caldilineaceae bacterium]